MTSRAHWKLLIVALITSGCQSTGSMLPWSASKDPVYSSAELVALDTPRPLAAGVESPVAPLITAAAKSASNIQQVSATVSGVSGDAGSVDELVRRGQATIREAGQDNPAKLQQARDILSQALAIDGANTAAHHSMAIVADLQQDFQAAEFHYKQALQARPQDASLLNDIGYSYLLQNRFHEATQYLNQTLQFEPQHERAHVNLSLLSLKRGDRAAAQNRLTRIYSPADAQTTLARLEQDLQTAPPMAVAAANAPMNAMPNQNLPQYNPQGQYPQQGQQPFQNASQNGTQYGNSGQMAQASQPVHVYPPGVNLVPEEATVQNYPAAVGVNGPANAGVRPQYPGIPNQPASNQQYGAMPGPPISQYNPNGTSPSPQQNQYGTVQYTNPQSQDGMPVYPTSQAQFASQPGQQGLLQQMEPTLQPQQGMNSSAYPSTNAPLAGLNAGPGALFPIQAAPVGAQSYAVPMPQPNSQFAMGQAGYPTTNMPAMPLGPNGGGYPAANSPLPVQPQMQLRNSAVQPQQSYQHNTSPASSTQYPPQNGGFNGQRGQQFAPPSQATPYLGAANGGQPMPGGQPQARTPLAAYEQQLQNLDNRFNQAVQQMDGNGMPLGASQGQYR